MSEPPVEREIGDRAAGRAPWRAIGYATLIGLSIMAGLWAIARRDPLRHAWRAAEDAADYAFHGSTTVHTRGPTAAYSVTGTGRVIGPITLTIRSFDAIDAPPTELRVDWPAVADGAGAAIAPRSVGAMLPAGDPLAFLASGHAARRGPVETVDGQPCRRFDFLVGARAYATWWEKRRRLLPVNADAGSLWRFEGSGSAWIDETTHRPCRIAARVKLPRLVNDSPGSGEVDWRYSDWGD